MCCIGLAVGELTGVLGAAAFEGNVLVCGIVLRQEAYRSSIIEIDGAEGRRIEHGSLPGRRRRLAIERDEAVDPPQPVQRRGLSFRGVLLQCFGAICEVAPQDRDDERGLQNNRAYAHPSTPEWGNP